MTFLRSTQKIILYVFDGLRPDHVTPERMPNLAAFAAQGTRFSNSRTVFPSETRVAAASLVTGAWPASHGIIANEFFDRRFSPDRPVDTGSRTDLEALEEALGGALLQRQTLSERLTQAGLRHAVVSSASPGASFLLDHQARRLGQFSWSVHERGNTPDDLAREIAHRYGPVPAAGVPNSARVDYAATVLVDFVLPRLGPDLAVFWSNEPDTTYHHRGVGSPEAQQALKSADAAFGRVVDFRHRSPERDRIQIIVASDHGQLTVSNKIDVIDRMRGAGIVAANRLGADTQAGVLLGSMTSVYARDREIAAKVEYWLAEQEWCGFIVQRDGKRGPRTMPMRILGTEHERAPALAFTFAGSEANDEHGVAGTSLFDGDLPVGAGTHGGLHRRELSNVLIMGGSAFGAGRSSALSAGILDVAPTIGQLLALEAGGFDGRVLTEGLLQPEDPGPTTEEVIDTDLGGRARRMLLRRVSGHLYLGGDQSIYT